MKKLDAFAKTYFCSVVHVFDPKKAQKWRFGVFSAVIAVKLAE
jgi:hypothetical protein